MNNFELVEKLVNTFGVSYEEAKIALEQCGWDPVEAAVILEKAKNGTPEPEEPKAESRVKGAAEAVRNEWREEGDKFFKSIWSFLSQNDFVIKKSSGEVFLDIPLWLSILLLCTFFWAVIFILGIVFIMGYRFSFTGPNLGKKNVQNAVDHVENAGKDFINRVKNSVAPDTCETVEMPQEPAAAEEPQNPETAETPENQESESSEDQQ